MEKKEKLLELKNKLEEVLKVTPYDLLEFNNREDEQSYIDKKTKEFDIYKNLIELEDSDGIIVITEDKTYAINPVFIHDDSFMKLFKFIYNGEKHFCKPDIIKYYNNLGNVLIRITNNGYIIGFDSYIPKELSEYQVRTLERFSRELGFVYKELERSYEFDQNAESNAKNIKYGIRTIRESLQDGIIKKKI